VRRDNQERFYINKIGIAAELSGVPLIGNLELRLAPDTDIAYTVPITAPVNSSSSQGEAKAGLDDQTAGSNWGNGHI
jgi:hypothetical protein